MLLRQRGFVVLGRDAHHELARRLVTPHAMLPPSMKPIPPNILRSVQPFAHRDRVAYAVGEFLVVGHDAQH